jgi:peptide-methionine (S)-S-oxide reductase
MIFVNEKNLEKATFGAGCFWCVEAIFKDLKGVHKVESGYAGGSFPNPTYEDVCSGKTDHAEVIQISFDPNYISYEELLNVFWHAHDPTTLNKQGADVGTQYRSAIFYHNDAQKSIAEASKEQTDNSDLWQDPIVTEISPINEFNKAEEYHQDYYEQNPNQMYCSYVIAPKLKQFRNEFGHLLKQSTSK